VWDLVKFRRERVARRRAALAGVREEMPANREAAGNNLTLIAIEDKAGGIANMLDMLCLLGWRPPVVWRGASGKACRFASAICIAPRAERAGNSGWRGGAEPLNLSVVSLALSTAL
jgi:hypothetical protein